MRKCVICGQLSEGSTCSDKCRDKVAIIRHFVVSGKVKKSAAAVIPKMVSKNCVVCNGSFQVRNTIRGLKTQTCCRDCRNTYMALIRLKGVLSGRRLSDYISAPGNPIK